MYQISLPRKTEGAGNAGRWPHPQGLWAEKEGAHKSVQGSPNIRHPLPNGFTAAPRSSWCAGLFSHHRLRKAFRKLDSSIGEPEPHGLTVRAPAARLAADARPSHPAPRIVTTRFAPHAGGMASLNHNFCVSEREIF